MPNEFKNLQKVPAKGIKITYYDSRQATKLAECLNRPDITVRSNLSTFANVRRSYQNRSHSSPTISNFFGVLLIQILVRVSRYFALQRKIP